MWLYGLESHAGQTIVEASQAVLFSKRFCELVRETARQADGVKDLFERHALFRPIHQRQHFEDYSVARAESMGKALLTTLDDGTPQSLREQPDDDVCIKY
jgi:hypothetical protein